MIRSLPSLHAAGVLEPVCITGVIRGREDEDGHGAKRSRHALNLEPQALQPEQLGLARADEGLFGVNVTIVGETKRARAALRDARINQRGNI